MDNIIASLYEEISNKIHEVQREYIHRNDIDQHQLDYAFDVAKDALFSVLHGEKRVGHCYECEKDFDFYVFDSTGLFDAKNPATVDECPYCTSQEWECYPLSSR